MKMKVKSFNNKKNFGFLPFQKAVCLFAFLLKLCFYLSGHRNLRIYVYLLEHQPSKPDPVDVLKHKSQEFCIAGIYIISVHCDASLVGISLVRGLFLVKAGLILRVEGGFPVKVTHERFTTPPSKHKLPKPHIYSLRSLF